MTDINIRPITLDEQKKIFAFDTSSELKLSDYISVINTIYESTKTKEEKKSSETIISDYHDVIPSGSASVVKLDEFSKNNDTSFINKDENIKFILQAAPGSMDKKDLPSYGADGLTNSAYNCLYLANQNNVKGIAFPIIGGDIFFTALNIKKNKLYELLLQGVANYFKDFSDSNIKVVLFAQPNNNVNDDNFEEVFTKFLTSNPSINGILKKQKNTNVKTGDSDTTTDIFDASVFAVSKIYNDEPTNDTKITALVNAANTELQFGTGLSGIFKDKINFVYNKLSDRIDKDSNVLIKKFHKAYDEYVKSLTGSSSPPPKTSTKTNVALANVLTTLEGNLSKDSESDAQIKKLGITLPDFLYPTYGDESAKKNLNSADPAIGDMIKEFETAVDGADKNFYLGACRSIQAAYDLEMSGIPTDASTEATNAKIRAKLLLNLRKNSLLLKVPARWDYATMSLLKVKPPPADPNELMAYSLEETIEYYSQEDVTGNKEFKELNIAENPTDVSVGGSTISGVDGRFTKGIGSNLNNACYFNTALQLLLCNEDFLQLMIQGNCQDKFIDSIQNNLNVSECLVKQELDVTINDDVKTESLFKSNKDILDKLITFFKQYLNNKDNTSIYTDIKKLLNIETKKDSQQDSLEVITKIITALDCCSNLYTKKIINNIKVDISTTRTIPTYNGNPEYKKIDPIPSNYLLLENELAEDLVNRGSYSKPDDFDKLGVINVQTLLDNYLKPKTEQAVIPESLLSSDDNKLYNDAKSLTSSKSFIGLFKQICAMSSNVDITPNYSGLITTLNSFKKTDNEYKNIADYNKGKFNNTYLDIIKTFIDSNIGKFDANDIIKICKDTISPANKDITDVMSSLTEPSGIDQTTENNIISVNKYLIIRIQRTLNGIKDNSKIHPDKVINVTNNKYILQGYSVHMGQGITGGAHYIFVKCDPVTGEEKLILNDGNLNGINSVNDDSKQKGVFGLIYKRADKKGQAGGGFKPNHNAITNHSKSRHNSSFKVSSSKTKGKSHNRSHTQRVK